MPPASLFQPRSRLMKALCRDIVSHQHYCQFCSSALSRVRFLRLRLRASASLARFF
jgi:hypothetical protein